MRLQNSSYTVDNYFINSFVRTVADAFPIVNDHEPPGKTQCFHKAANDHDKRFPPSKCKGLEVGQVRPCRQSHPRDHLLLYKLNDFGCI